MDAALLQCIICPGQPRFSDVSHLLTHVSSKAHLSHYFKLQVRGHQEDEALELLLEYDGWFNTNNLPQLLSERIGSKDDRKKKRKSQAKTADTGQHSASIKPRGAAPVDPSPRPSTSLPEYLDPRLADSYDKVKHDLETEDASFSCHVTPATSAAAAAGACMTRGADFKTDTTQAVDKAKLREWSEEDAPVLQKKDEITFPVTPTPPTWIRNRPSEAVGSGPSDPFVDGKTPNQTSDDVDADKERADEMARLKGVLWPGMDIFDSATQQMRRKRNQKKDGTVLKKMELTSSLVEPTELIFSPSGILRKQRVISGNVEDDSPLKGESPIPKRRPPRPRPSRPKRSALSQIDPNVARGQDRKRAKRAAKQGPSNDEEETSQDNPTPFRFHNLLSGIRPTFAGDDEEFDLSVQAFGKRARSGFTIFADEDDQDMQASQSQRAQSKISRDTLTPARLVLNGMSELSADLGGKAEQPSFDKENIEPILNSQGRIDLPTWSNSPFLKRCNNPRYTSRYMFDEISAVGLRPDEEREKCGYHSNPLLAPSPKMDFYENDAYDHNVTVVSSGWTSISPAVSSEATVSEEDHHELARLYLESTAE